MNMESNVGAKREDINIRQVELLGKQIRDAASSWSKLQRELVSEINNKPEMNDTEGQVFYSDRVSDLIARLESTGALLKTLIIDIQSHLNLK